MKIKRRITAALLVFAVLMPLTSGFGRAEAVNDVPQVQQAPFTATPYTKEDGTLVQGLEEAVQGKRHWLESTEAMPVEVKEDTAAHTLSIGNGVIERTFQIPETGGTVFYTKSYQNTYIGKELLKEEPMPEVYIGLYDKEYDEVYHDDGVTTVAECFEDGVIQYDPDYYFIGGTDPERAFVFDGYEISECEKPFEWTPKSKRYSDPAAGEWPPKGKHIEFNFSAPADAPAAYHGVKVKIIYEMYDNLAAMKKRVEITNEGQQKIMVGRLATEVLNGNENLDELFFKETSYTCGDDTTIPISTKLPCSCDKEKETSPFYGLKDMEHTCYEVGPAYELENGQTFASFDTYELIHSTYWFELRMRERLGMYRTLFPWITDNPLTFHTAKALSKEVIDHAAEAGIEMIIQSFGSWDTSGHMLSRDQKTLDHYKELIDYAHSKDIEIGIYQAQYTREQYGGNGKGSPSYGVNGIGKWNTWCMASAAFDDYWDNFKYFIKYTGVDCVEIDGPYPGSYCNNGHKHINEDKETDPDPEGTDKTVGTPSKHAVHNGFFDSQVKQWENSVRFLCKELRDMDVYIKVPGWYYLNGGNKCGIGYEERAFNASRQEQLLYTRQIMHNASYARTMSMSWSHIPFIVYQGEYDGPGTAVFSPFKDHAQDYNWVLAQNIGNGITTDFRGTSFYDEETKDICDKWVSFFNRYRGIINADLVHMTQAAYEDEDKDRSRGYQFDTLYHVDANNEGEKGLLWVYNQTDEPRTETITVPMYYTGLTNLEYPPVPLKGSLGTKDIHLYYKWPPNYKWLPDEEANYVMPEPTGEVTGTASFLREGAGAEIVSIDSNGNAQIEVTLPAMSFTYYTIYHTEETPDITVEVGAVQNVKAEAEASDAVTLTWDKDVSVKVTEDGEENEHSTVTVDQYNIYRDDSLIGSTVTNEFRDESLKENTAYTYEVKAVAAGIEGEAGTPVQVTTGWDTAKPEMIRAVMEKDNQITLTFSEKVDAVSAQTISNYTLSGGISIHSAILGQDGKTVYLETDPVQTLKSYTLAAANIKDQAAAQNVMEPVEKTVIYGYIAQYHMDSAEGNVLEDAFGQRNGEIQNVQIVSINGRSAAQFNASDTSYASLGTGVFNAFDNSSISLWINPADVSGKQSVISQGQEGHADYSIYIEDGMLKFYACDDGEETNSVTLSGGNVTAGQWYFVTLVTEGSSFKLYVDGEMKEQASYQGDKTRETVLYLGAMQNNAGGDRTMYYSGIIDEVSLYHTALTDGQVRQIYENDPAQYGALLEQVRSIDGSYYTQQSFQALIDAADTLESTLNSGTDAQGQRKAYEALKNAKTSLVKKDGYENLIAVYKMDEKDGSMVKEGVSGNNGELKNGDYLRYGTPFGNGIYITTVQKDYIKIPVSPLNEKEQFTVSGWFKSQLKAADEIKSAGKQVLLADTNHVLTLYLDNERLALDVGGTQIISEDKIAYETVTGGEERQAWNQFALTRDGNTFILYMNGKETARTDAENVSLNGGLVIGCDGDSGNYFNGLINLFQFYDTAASPSDAANMMKEIPFIKGQETNIALYKPFMGDKNSLDNPEYINDGKVLAKASSDTPWTARGKLSVTVPKSGLKFGYDLGQEYTIGAWSLTEFYRNYNHPELRRYTDVIIQISQTADFSSGVTTLFNTDADGSMGYGVGEDHTYYSFELGYDRVLEQPVKGRYVRLMSCGWENQNGAYDNTANMGELELFAADTIYSAFEARAADGGYDIGVTIGNYSGETVEGGLYAAVYSSAGALKGLEKYPVSLAAEATLEDQVTVSCEQESGDMVKVMLWDHNMKPLLGAWEMNMGS